MEFLIDTLIQIPEKVLGFFGYIVEVLASTFEALTLFYQMLDAFDQTIIDMADSCGTSEFINMPILEAIGTFHYLVGDVAFYMIYLSVLAGCLLTIYKLVTLIYEAIDALVYQLTGSNCKTQIASLLSKIFG